jgi:hypothetical protein
MEPKIWGPPFWFMLHTISFSYPTNPSYHDKRHYYDYFQNVYHIIPCEECQDSYLQYLQENPISSFLDSNHALSKWVVELHNKINQKLDKPTQSYQDVAQRYYNIYQHDKYKPEFIRGLGKGEENYNPYVISSRSNFLQVILAIGLLSLIYMYLLQK